MHFYPIDRYYQGQKDNKLTMTAEQTKTPSLASDVAQDPASLLAWQMTMGADEAIGDEPVDRFVAAPQPVAAPNVAARNAADTKVPTNNGPRPVVAQPVQSIAGASSEKAAELAAAAATLDELKTAISGFDGGLLKRSAKNLVFAGGTVGAPVMVIGEAPGAEDDRQGKPFVGASGQLLDKMLVAAGFSRDTNVYLTTLLPWRPLGGSRKPDPAVAGMCLPFVQRHIELAKPKMIILLGAVPAKALLETTDGITRLRGKWKTISLGGNDTPCLPIYNPDYLMRQPHLKGLAWRDLLAAKQKFIEVTA